MKAVFLKIGVFSVVIAGSGFYAVQNSVVNIQESNSVHVTSGLQKQTELSAAATGVLFGSPPLSQLTIKETTLNVALRGVITSSAQEKSMAILLIDGHQEKLVSISEEITRGVTLIEVKDEYVVIDRAGKFEKLSFSKKGKFTLNASTANTNNREPKRENLIQARPMKQKPQS